MKSILLGIILLCFGTSIYAVNVDAGEDKSGCPGSEIQIGGTPTAGPDAPESYKYQWRSSDGSFSSTEANPTITIPNEVTIYTVEVEDKDGFKCEDQMKVTPVKIENISFSKQSLPADGSSTVTASAVIIPPDREVRWSIEGNALGCTINESTGVITAGEEAGYITIRASDKESFNNGVDCYKEKELCVGNECCEDISSRTFGPISVNFPEPIPSKGEDDDGWCIYSTSKATIHLEMLGVFLDEISYDLGDVTISWKEMKTETSYNFKEVTLSWKGKAPTRQFSVLQANLTEIELSVNSSGAISGKTKFTINQVDKVNMGGIAVLEKGTKGTFTYMYTSSGSFQGDWDFGGITGIKISLMKGSSKIGTLSGSLDKNGNLNGKFKAQTPGTFATTSGFTCTLTKLDLSVTWNISENDLTFNSGTGEIKINKIKNVNGEIILALVFSGESVAATSTLKDISAFGCEVSGSVTTDFSFEFELNSIVGSGISAKHADLDQSFSNVGFEIKNGALENFSIGAIEVRYKNGVFFSMSNASYNKVESSLVFDAKFIVAGQTGEVSRFAIDGEGGITIKGLKIKIEKSPISASASFELGEDYFKGKFKGKFKGGIGIEGAAVLGATANYNYCYFALALEGGKTGIPLGSSGLKVNKLGGEFGYNWLPGENFGTISGKPQENTLMIGFLLGIGDVAGLTQIQGGVRLILGEANAIDLNGKVTVTASSPYYLEGNMFLHYVLGTYEINGSLSSTVKFPPKSGNIVYLNSGNINFGIKNSSWYVNATGLEGKIFNAISVSTGLQLSSPLSDLGAMTGSLNGSLSYDKTYSYTYPEGFDPTTCASAQATDNFAQFGVKGSMDLHLGGALNTSLNNEGIIGVVSVDASGSGDLKVKWPCMFCGDDCVSQYGGTASGLLKVEHTGDKTSIHGELTFKRGDEEEKGKIDFEL